MAEPSPAAPVRRSWRWRLFNLARNLLAAVGLVFVVYLACFDLSEILSPSMQPTLCGDNKGVAANDFVLAEKVSYRFRDPRRFEIVQFANNDGISVMKRVVGLPGEKVAVVDSFLKINDQRIDRPAGLEFLKYIGIGKLFNGKQADCGASGYFVLGDDSKDSEDSRYEGPVDRSRLKARAWLIIWPPRRIGFVH